MFVQILVKDTIKVLPAHFGKKYTDALVEAIHAKYANKVIANVGLCICVYELESHGDALLYPGDANAHSACTFRLVVFRPFKNEIIQGKLTHQDRTGIVVSLGFFIDIFVPGTDLLQNSEFDEAQSLWVWRYEGNDAYYDIGEDIKVRVMNIEYAPNRHVVTKPSDVLDGSAPKALSDFIPPMRVYATINDSGLGLTQWWEGSQSVDDDSSASASSASDSFPHADAAASAAAGDDNISEQLHSSVRSSMQRQRHAESASDAAHEDEGSGGDDGSGGGNGGPAPEDDEAWEQPPEEDELIVDHGGRGGGDEEDLGDVDY